MNFVGRRSDVAALLDAGGVAREGRKREREGGCFLGSRCEREKGIGSFKLVASM